MSERVCEAEREKERDKENGEKLTGMNEIGGQKRVIGSQCVCVCALYEQGVRSVLG